MSIEQKRLDAHYNNNDKEKWLKWGPYLSERQWGTVREDYSEHGEAWDYFPHDHARSRVYRWGEDGIAGITDDQCNLNFCTALWNGKDPIIKERLFGLTGPQGNHAEDVKELYYYLDSTPTHSYMKHLYKYPQSEFPYDDLVQTNRARSKDDHEYEILDTGIFEDGKYFDVFTEYAKAGENDILIKITTHNRSANSAELTLLPTLWFTNLWSFGLMKERPLLSLSRHESHFGEIKSAHPVLGEYYFYFDKADRLLFTENETNTERLFNQPNPAPRVKDSINDAVVTGDFSIFDGITEGTKFSPLYKKTIPGDGKIDIRLRLSKDKHDKKSLNKTFDKVFQDRIKEADEFYAQFKTGDNDDHKNIQRQAFAGMLWTKQYYYFDIPQWLNGDEGQVPPPEARKDGRNSDWTTLNNRDIISMPDKWEYPWYAAWDTAFHCVPLAMIDVEFSKNQLILFLREWYMKPNGQLPAYEWAFGDVNPPVHAWGCLQVFHIEKQRTGKGDTDFLKRVFQKLLINFTWWVNRKDRNDNNIFEGGFLGLDNIGIFDRSAEIPGGGYLKQADGTSWMAMYCLNMLEMAIEIAQDDPIGFEDVATKFLEHFVYIAEALNCLSIEEQKCVSDEEDGFFYDVLVLPNEERIQIKVRSLVGLTTLFATLIMDKKKLEKLPDFTRRLEWFMKYREKNHRHLVIETHNGDGDMLLSLIPRDRLKKVLNPLLSTEEFFSPYGIRSLSKAHEDPFRIHINGQEFGLQYEPAESKTTLFGGNSNWRGPVWTPMNYLLIESLKELHSYYGEECLVQCPYDNQKMKNLGQIAEDISKNLVRIFERDDDGKRPVNALHEIYQKDPNFRDLVLFYEYFHGENGRGVGASHQTGWTGIVAEMIDCIHNDPVI